MIFHSGITKELAQQRRQQITVKVAASRRQGRPHRRTWWEREFVYYPIAPARARPSRRPTPCPALAVRRHHIKGSS